MSVGGRGLNVAIVGGSIGGLCAGNVLASLGANVQIYERSRDRLSSRGAGIVVQPELVQLIQQVRGDPLATTRCSVRRSLEGRSGRTSEIAMPQSFTSWEAIYESLRSAFPDQGYHLGAEVVETSADSEAARFTVDDKEVRVDLLVAADGFRSTLRKAFAPETRTRYAGYVAWRGVLDEGAMDPSLATFFDDAFTFCGLADGGHALAYFIPGDELGTDSGARRLNWVWYVDVPEGDELAALLTDKNNTGHEAAIPPGLTSPDARSSLHQMAKNLDPRFEELVLQTPDPFLQAIVDVAPERMVSGRACLLGDAAFVVRPHTAGASAKAAGDALELGASLRRQPEDVNAAFLDWEGSRLHYGRGLLEHGIRLGDRTRRRSAL